MEGLGAVQVNESFLIIRQAPDEKKSSISTVKRSNTTANRPTYQRAQSPSPDPKPRPAPVQQNLRFFGDTDLESLSKASTNIGRKRTALIPNSAHSMQNLRSNRPSQSRTVTDLNTHSRHHVRTAASMQNLNSVIICVPMSDTFNFDRSLISHVHFVQIFRIFGQSIYLIYRKVHRRMRIQCEKIQLIVVKPINIQCIIQHQIQNIKNINVDNIIRWNIWKMMKNQNQFVPKVVRIDHIIRLVDGVMTKNTGTHTDLITINEI